jgi:heat shock protein HslJ
MRGKLYGWAAALCLLVGVAAAQAGQNAMVPDLASTKWRAERIAESAVSSDVQPTLEFSAANQVSGTAGCNRFTGMMRHDGKTLAFGPLASTRMMCAPPVMDQEAAYLQALGSVRSFEVGNDGKLVLLDQDAHPILRFAPL